MKPGTLSALLQEIAAAPPEAQGGGWESVLRPGAVVGRFELVRELGRGGFGVVWEARDRELERPVAFKAVRAGGKAAVREERLLREAEAAARLSHPNIVTLFDIGRAEQGPYLVLELLQGRTLEERLSQGPLSLREAVRIASEVAKGVAHAHAKGVVHRDLKPVNVFLCDDGQVKVLDFGLAHAFGQRRQDGGTPAYMAPEQWQGAPEDERTDVFALGVMLFQVLSGKLPFPEAKALASSNPAPLLETPEAPALGELVGRMLEKEPLERPRDGGSVEKALSSIREALGRTGPSPAPVRVRRRLPRLAFMGLLAALLGAVLAGVLALYPRLHPWPTGVAVPSIAVLPFADMSPGKDQEYFADGIAEEILNALAQVDGLHVVGRTSSFSFKGTNRKIAEIGRELNVGTVLEGSVRKAGGRIRITAQLVQAADGFHLWSRTFDRDLSDVFAVQDEIARAVVEALRLKLLSASGAGRGVITVNREAYDQYLLGRDLLRTQEIGHVRRALAAFERAISLDGGFALAWAGVADAIRLLEGLAGEGTSPEERHRALAAAEQAVALAPDLPDAYVARGTVRSAFLLDWEGSLADMERARALAPGDASAATGYGRVLTELGRLREGVAVLKRAAEIDPLSASAWTLLGRALVSAGDHERGRAALARALEISPRGGVARFYLFVDLAAVNRPDLALAAAEPEPLAWVRLTGVSIAQHDLGHARESQAALEALVKGNAADAAYQIAEAHAWRGETDQAFEWLERARTQADTGLGWIKTDPLLRKIRGDPRFAEMLRKLKLPVE